MREILLRQIPPGIKDYLFEEAKRRRDVERQILDVLRDFDYREIITPTFEYYDVFATAGYNNFEEKIYRFLDHDGQLLALRSDFTAQIARIAASRFEGMTFPVRVYYSGKVFRQEKLQAGRSREAWQVGLERIGEDSAEADLEVLTIVHEVMQRLKAKSFQISLGNIEYFNGIVEKAALAGKELEELKYLIEKKDSAQLRSRLQEIPISDVKKEALLRLTALYGGPEVLDEAMRGVSNPRSEHAVRRLKTLHQAMQRRGLANHLVLDLSEVQGMGYYTGIMVRVYLEGAGFEVGSGGRYDDLIAKFGKAMPAVGFSFDVDRLIKGLS